MISHGETAVSRQLRPRLRHGSILVVLSRHEFFYGYPKVPVVRG
jgi:hypothetical protein